MIKNTLQKFLILLLLLSVAATGVAVAEKSITIDVDGVTASAGSTITVPVTIHDAENILGFLIHVPNQIEGTTITINSSKPLDGGTYIVSSSETQTEQAVLWFTANNGIFETAPLFYIDILPTKNTASMIPVTVEVLDEMYDAAFNEVHVQYPVENATLTILGTSGTTSTPISSGSSDPTTVETENPKDNMTTSTDKTEDNSLASGELPTHSSTTPLPAVSPAPVLGLILAFGTVSLITIRQRRF